VSSFLTGVVRRGAGLPLPVTIRPAMGPQQIAPSLPVSHQGRESDVQQRLAGLLVPAASRQEIRNIEARNCEPPLPMQLPARIPRDSGDQGSPRARAGATVPAPQDSSREPERRRVPLHRGAADYPSPPEPVVSHSLPRPRTTVTDVAEVREGGRKHQMPDVPPAAQPGTRQGAVASAGTISRGDAHEKRNIQVKIGRVEIRSNQVAPTVRPGRPNATRGFDDFKLSRNYFDRNLR
jgi:hypothetical protein